MVIGTRTQVKAYPCENHAGTSLKLRDNVKSLGVTFDYELSFDKHVNLVCRACNYDLWSLRHIRKYLTVDMANTIACSVVGYRLDYCNFILYKTTKANITKLQRVQNSLARVVLQMPRVSRFLGRRWPLSPYRNVLQHSLRSSSGRTRFLLAYLFICWPPLFTLDMLEVRQSEV